MLYRVVVESTEAVSVTEIFTGSPTLSFLYHVTPGKFSHLEKVGILLHIRGSSEETTGTSRKALSTGLGHEKNNKYQLISLLDFEISVTVIIFLYCLILLCLYGG